MTTLQIEVNDKVLHSYGKEALTKQLNRYVKLEAMRLAALEVQQAVTAAQLDNDALWEEARVKAWEDFKTKRPHLFT